MAIKGLSPEKRQPKREDVHPAICGLLPVEATLGCRAGRAECRVCPYEPMSAAAFDALFDAMASCRTASLDGLVSFASGEGGPMSDAHSLHVLCRYEGMAPMGLILVDRSSWTYDSVSWRVAEDDSEANRKDILYASVEVRTLLQRRQDCLNPT